MTAPRFKLSINESIINKASPEAHKRFGRGWKPVELTLEEFTKHVKCGHAFAPQYHHQHRKSQKFIGASFLAADFDGTMTLDEARNNAFIHSYASLIYTTPSHTPREPRFRVVFVFDESVTDGQLWADANFGLAHKLGSDATINDAARCFYGSTKAEVWAIGQILPADLAEELAAYGRELRAAQSEGYPVNSTRKVSANLTVKLASGELVPFDLVPPQTSIHCPYHDDRNPSAFTVRSWKSNSIGVHCKACCLTYWQSDGDEYDFAAFDNMFARRQKRSETERGEKGLARFFPPDPKFTEHHDRFLPHLIYEPGITMVKSPKGTGKTEALKELITAIAAGRYKQGTKRKDRVKSILLIGHRRALLREAAAKLGLRCYLDPRDEVYPRLKTLAVCLDSLAEWNEPYVARRGGHRLIRKRESAHDLVIIDESEQVFSHLIGDTIQGRKGGIERCYDALHYEVANSKAVIALDADLGMLTAHALQTMRPQDWRSRCRIVYNKPVIPKQERVIRLYSRERALQHELMAAIERGERCFVACNSKKCANVLHEMVRRRFSGRIKCRVITSDNSRDANEIEFVKNIQSEFLKIQVLICSPSLGTGIDITFPDPEGPPGGLCKVDQVFGFFYPLVNTHTDMDQQLARVRNPGSISVWINPARFSFSSSFDVIRDDLARSYYVPRAVTGRSADGLVDYKPDHPLLMICTHVIAAQRASKNKLIDLFCELRETHGWKIERVEAQLLPTAERSEAEAALYVRHAEGLIEAPVLDDPEYLDLTIREASGDPLTLPERLTLEKNTLERALGVPVTQEIITLNYDGHLIDRVAVLADLFQQWEWLYPIVGSVLAAENQPLARLPKLSLPPLLTCFLTVSGLCPGGAIDQNARVDSSSLQKFVRLCRDNQTVIETVLGQQMRKDLEVNPVRQLNAFLKLIGLKLEATKRHKKQGRASRSYGFDAQRFAVLRSLAAAFKSQEAIKNELLNVAEAS